MDDLLATAEAAHLLGKSQRTVRGYIERGPLPVARRINAPRPRAGAPNAGAPAPDDTPIPARIPASDE